jgi:hypothetical protein
MCVAFTQRARSAAASKQGVARRIVGRQHAAVVEVRQPHEIIAENRGPEMNEGQHAHGAVTDRRAQQLRLVPGRLGDEPAVDDAVVDTARGMRRDEGVPRRLCGRRPREFVDHDRRRDRHFPAAHDPCRMADGDGPVGDGAGDDGAGAEDAPLTDVGHDARAVADPRIRADPHLLEVTRLLIDRHVRVVERVLFRATEDMDVAPEEHVVPDFAQAEIAVQPDVDATADAGAGVADHRAETELAVLAARGERETVELAPRVNARVPRQQREPLAGVVKRDVAIGDPGRRARKRRPRAAPRRGASPRISPFHGLADCAHRTGSCGALGPTGTGPRSAARASSVCPR